MKYCDVIEKNAKLRIVYMGTPRFAASILESLSNYEHAEIVALYAQPDRKAGRGNKLQEPETKILAQKLGIEVYQPQSFKNNQEELAKLQALKPDVLIVAAYGMILPQAVLDIPVYGAYNVHASLLPKYRGAAPVQRSLMAGDTQSGVTIMQMEAGLDTGPMLLQQAINIHDTESFSDNSESLLEALAESGAKLMMVALNMLRENRLNFVVQNDQEASYASKLTKQEAVINWQSDATKIHNHVRGFSPNPGATSLLNFPGKEAVPVRVEKGFVLERLDFNPKEFYEKNSLNEQDCIAGTLLGLYKNYLVVKCEDDHYGISQIRMAGKASMDAKAFYNGYFKNSPSLFFSS